MDTMLYDQAADMMARHDWSPPNISFLSCSLFADKKKTSDLILLHVNSNIDPRLLGLSVSMYWLSEKKMQKNFANCNW